MNANRDKERLLANPLDRISMTELERMIAEAHLRRAEFIAELLIRAGASIRAAVRDLAHGLQAVARRRRSVS